MGTRPQATRNGGGGGSIDQTPPPTAHHPFLPCQASAAVVYLHGAHVTSYTPPTGGRDVIFVSRDAVYAPPKAIRGGVPLCWPQFGDMGPMAAQHGFARNSAFVVEREEEGGACVTLLLAHAGGDGAPFPHAADVRVRVSVADGALTQTLTVNNTGRDRFEFTTALHTYFAVDDIDRVAVGGLHGAPYLDSLDGRARKIDTADAVTFDREVDRIYVGVPPRLTIRDGARTIALTTRGLPDAVVWNPWIDKARATADMGDDEYKRFVCVEAAVTQGSGAVGVDAGGEWVGEQRVEVVA